MGLLKSILKRFRCKSKCAFNSEDFNQDLLNVDLSKYRLKVNDLMAIEKIIRKRPSINTYKHTRNNLTEI
tara:strand:+ start:97 stop:306 length:210 start_codon:yes stop_codon:yes gene_type:complete